MDKKQIEKIDRMTRLARPFLWNLCPGYFKDGRKEGEPPKRNSSRDPAKKKEAIFWWLTKNGFEVERKETIEDWVNQICDEPGVEQVFKRLIIPELKARIGTDTMNDLRKLWIECRIPDRKFVNDQKRKFNINLKDQTGSVLEIHWGFGHVQRFGPLAPIIFEDAVEWLEEEGLLTKLP